MAADDEAREREHEPEREWREQGLFLEQSVEQHDHDAEAGETLRQIAR
ncbi:hypothetical protein [Bradyrhizobium sp. 25ACV]